MGDKLRKASKFFWILCAIALIAAVTGSVYIRYGVSHFDEINVTDFLIVIPVIFLEPLMDWRGMYEPMQLAISYLLFMVPAFFAAIAIVLRMIAKAFGEHTIQVMNLMNEEKKKSKGVIQ